MLLAALLSGSLSCLASLVYNQDYLSRDFPQWAGPCCIHWESRQSPIDMYTDLSDLGSSSVKALLLVDARLCQVDNLN